MHTFAQPRRRTLALCVMTVAVLIAAMPMTASAHHGHSPRRTPIVLFPAWHFTRLEVTVHNQRTDPACPRSGTLRGPRLLRSRARRSRRSAATSC